MKNLARTAFLGAWMMLAAGLGTASASPPELRSILPSAMLGGSSRFTSWGFDVYDASLWVEPAFNPNTYERHVFALELTYLRAFTGDAITQRSIEEMRRLSNAPDARLKSWQRQMRGVFPDIKKGDRITGIHRPGVGAMFMTNGQPSGAIQDAEFGKLFFGIWLSTHTSEPRLRDALLARLAAQ